MHNCTNTELLMTEIVRFNNRSAFTNTFLPQSVFNCSLTVTLYMLTSIENQNLFSNTCIKMHTYVHIYDITYDMQGLHFL